MLSAKVDNVLKIKVIYLHQCFYDETLTSMETLTQGGFIVDKGLLKCSLD